MRAAKKYSRSPAIAHAIMAMIEVRRKWFLQLVTADLLEWSLRLPNRHRIHQDNIELLER
jgi:hypothetical protein